MSIFFSQGIAVLFSEAPDSGSLRHHLERHGHTIAADEDAADWPEMQGAGFTLKTDFESGATCSVDICEFPWPDEMGASGDPTLLTSAHALGAFGPFVHPGALARALQAPACQTDGTAACDHRAFVRLRVSHFFPAPEGTEEARPMQPEKAHPAQELGLLLHLAASLAGLQGALAYFNPSSELILSLETLGQILSGAQEQSTYPIEAVCRLRGCAVDDGWSFVDSIGMEQLGMQDHEFAWVDAAVTRSEQISFLINLLHYQTDNAVRFASGHTTDGPHERRWRTEEREQACMMPPRKVLHWTMDGSPPEPPRLSAAPMAVAPGPSEETSPATEADEVIAKLEAWLPHRDAIRMRAVKWMRSPSFRTVYYDEAHIPMALKLALAQEMSKKEAAETWKKVQIWGQQTPELWNQYQHLASHGQVWFAVPMMTNPAFNKEAHSLLPCGVIVATEQTSTEIIAAGVYAMVAYELYAGEGDKTKFPGTARIMSNDEYRLFYREAFPLKETHGHHFTLLSVLMRKSWMPPEDVPFIPFLAMPGPQGAIVQIPWHIATGTPAPPGSMNPGRFAEVARLDRQVDRMVEEHNASRSGCGNLIRLIIWGIFIAGLIGGILLAVLDKSSGIKKSPTIQKKAFPIEPTNPR